MPWQTCAGVSRDKEPAYSRKMVALLVDGLRYGATTKPRVLGAAFTTVIVRDVTRAAVRRCGMLFEQSRFPTVVARSPGLTRFQVTEPQRP